MSFFTQTRGPFRGHLRGIFTPFEFSIFLGIFHLDNVGRRHDGSTISKYRLFRNSRWTVQPALIAVILPRFRVGEITVRIPSLVRPAKSRLDREKRPGENASDRASTHLQRGGWRVQGPIWR